MFEVELPCHEVAFSLHKTVTLPLTTPYWLHTKLSSSIADSSDYVYAESAFEEAHCWNVERELCFWGVALWRCSRGDIIGAL